MAGENIYIGEMIAGLQAKIDTMTAAMSAQGLKMDNQITALNAINTTVGTSVKVGNIKAGVTNAKIVKDTEVSVTGNGVYGEIGRVKCFADGYVTLSAFIKHSASVAARFAYSVNGGTTKTYISTAAGITYVEKTVDISVTNLMEIILYIEAGSSGIAYCQASSCKVKYDVLNLVADGYVV